MKQISEKIFISFLVLFSVILFLFLILEMAPGSPLDLIVPPGSDQQIRAELSAQFGFDGTVSERFFNWIKNTFSGNLGYSLVILKGSKVTELIAPAFIKSAFLCGLSLIFAVLACYFLVLMEDLAPKKIKGLISQLKYISAIPAFVAGYLFIAFGNEATKGLPWALKDGWFPLGSNTDLHPVTMTLAALCFAFFNAHLIDGVLLLKQSLEDVRELGYVKKLKLNLNSPFKFYFRNSLPVILDYLSSLLPRLLGFLVIIEIIFTIQGLGRLAWDAALSRDYMVLTGVSIVMTLITLVWQILMEFFILALDPRRREN